MESTIEKTDYDQFDDREERNAFEQRKNAVRISALNFSKLSDVDEEQARESCAQADENAGLLKEKVARLETLLKEGSA